MRFWLGVAALFALCGCSGISNPFVCEDGGTDCGSAGGRGGGGVTAAGGGSGMGGGASMGGGSSAGGGTAAGGGSATGGGSAAGGGTAAGGGSGGGVACAEDWQCGPWSPDAGMGYRRCIDANATGTTLCKPLDQGPLPALDYNYYRCRVQPIIALSCSMSGCHGNEGVTRPYHVFARGRLRNHETVTLAWPPCLIGTPQTFDLYDEASFTVQCWGNMALTLREWRMNFDNARAQAMGLASPAQSELLTQPQNGTGFAHAGMKFWDATSTDYQTISSWLGGATLATCDAGFNDHN